MIHLTRRFFLKGAAVAALSGPCVVGSRALGADGNVAPSERIATGHIGFRAQGAGHLGSCQKNRDTQVVGLCDVDYSVLQRGEESTKKAYADQAKSG